MPTETAPSRRALLAVLFGSFALKLGLLFWLGDIAPIRDERRYCEVGLSLAAGEGLKYTNKFWDDLHSPPLYPFLMGLVTRLGGGPFEVKLLQVALSTLGALLLFRFVANRLDERTALAATACVAFYPTLVAFTHYNWNETVFLFLLSAGLCALLGRERVGPPRALGAGVLFGAAVLCRAELVYWLPLLAAWMLWADRRRETLARIGALVAGVVLAMAPWWLYVARHYDGFVLVSTGQSSMWHFSYNAFPPDSNDLGMSGEEGLDREAHRAEARGKVRDPDPIRRAQKEKERGLAWLREHPDVAFERFWTRLGLLLYPTSFLARHVALDHYTRAPDGSEVREPFSRATKLAVLWLVIAGYAALFGLGLVGLVALPSTPLRLLLLVSCAYFLFVYGMGYAVTRYRLVLVPFVAIGAGWCVAHPSRLRERLRRPTVAGPAALASALFLFGATRHLERLFDW